MRLRIHHFFDIIRDFGSGKKIVPHSHGHSYHTVAEQIRENANLELEVVIASDEICISCSHLIDGVCDDVITHRKDFKGKEEFNNHLDERIMQVCNLDGSAKYSPEVLCSIAPNYLKNIEYIYEGNDPEHTLERKKNVLNGLKYYTQKHVLGLNFKSVFY